MKRPKDPKPICRSCRLRFKPGLPVYGAALSPIYLATVCHYCARSVVGDRDDQAQRDPPPRGWSCDHPGLVKLLVRSAVSAQRFVREFNTVLMRWKEERNLPLRQVVDVAALPQGRTITVTPGHDLRSRMDSSYTLLSGLGQTNER